MEPFPVTRRRVVELVGRRGYPTLGVVAIGKGGMNVRDEPDEQAEEPGPLQAAAGGCQTWHEVRQMQRHRRSLGQGRAVIEHECRHLMQGADGAKTVPGRSGFVEAVDDLATQAGQREPALGNRWTTVPHHEAARQGFSPTIAAAGHPTGPLAPDCLNRWQAIHDRSPGS